MRRELSMVEIGWTTEDESEAVEERLVETNRRSQSGKNSTGKGVVTHGELMNFLCESMLSQSTNHLSNLRSST